MKIGDLLGCSPRESTARARGSREGGSVCARVMKCALFLFAGVAAQKPPTEVTLANGSVVTIHYPRLDPIPECEKVRSVQLRRDPRMFDGYPRDHLQNKIICEYLEELRDRCANDCKTWDSESGVECAEPIAPCTTASDREALMRYAVSPFVSSSAGDYKKAVLEGWARQGLTYSEIRAYLAAITAYGLGDIKTAELRLAELPRRVRQIFCVSSELLPLIHKMGDGPVSSFWLPYEGDASPRYEAHVIALRKTDLCKQERKRLGKPDDTDKAMAGYREKHLSSTREAIKRGDGESVIRALIEQCVMAFDLTDLGKILVCELIDDFVATGEWRGYFLEVDVVHSREVFII